MTWPRVIVLLCAALALVDGAVWQAVGFVVFVAVLFVARPNPRADRLHGVRFRWHGGGWWQQ